MDIKQREDEVLRVISFLESGIEDTKGECESTENINVWDKVLSHSPVAVNHKSLLK